MIIIRHAVLCGTDSRCCSSEELAEDPVRRRIFQELKPSNRVPGHQELWEHLRSRAQPLGSTHRLVLYGGIFVCGVILRSVLCGLELWVKGSSLRLVNIRVVDIVIAVHL